MWKTLAVTIVAATLLLPTRASALENEELLSLVAMPLAVAAVSQIADVPVTELMDVVAMLNNAAVPPAQFIEVVRYVPVALVEAEQGFVDFLRLREEEGLRGTAFVTSIEEEFRVVYGLPDVELTVTEPRTIDIVEADFVRAPLLQAAERKARPRHPHGGPPGQLKKAAASTRVVTQVVEDRPAVRSERKAERKAERKIRPRKVEAQAKAAKRSQTVRENRKATAKPAKAKARGNSNGRARVSNNTGKAKGNSGNGNGKSRGNAKAGKGKGGGKGKGKG